MKIICVEGLMGDMDAGYMTVRPDSAVLRENDDFYVPHFSSDIECSVGVLVRINRLAKCLDERFASRCYDSVGAGVAFVARDVMLNAIAKGNPCDEAYCFDRSFAVSPEWVDVATIGTRTDFEFAIGENRHRVVVDNLCRAIDSAVSRASCLATLKTGDMVYVGIGNLSSVRRGDDVEVRLDNRTLLHFGIK